MPPASIDTAAGPEAHDPHVAAAERVAPAHPTRREWLLLAAVVALQALITGWFASKSSWVQDDLILFQDAAAGDVDWDYLASREIVHFAPGHRLVSLYLFRHAPFDYGAALAFALVAHAAGVVLVQRIVRWFAGAAWWSYALAFAYGTSIVVLPSMLQFAAVAQVVAPGTLTLAAIHAYLCWRSSGRRGWLVWSLIAVAGALSFYEKAALVPVYLVLMRVLLLDQERPVRDNLRAAAREWRVWAAYGAVLAGWFVLYRTRPYAESWESAGLGEILEFVRIAWSESYVPATLGVYLTGEESSLLRTPAVIAGQLALLAGVVLTVRRRRSAWRAWAFLAAVFVLGAVVIFPRVAVWGGWATGHVLRYQVEMAVLTPLVVAAAIGRRKRAARGHGVVALAAIGVAAYSIAMVISAGAVVDDWPGERSKRFFANLRGDVAKLHGAGEEPVLLNEALPDWLIHGWHRPGVNQAVVNLPLFLDGVHFNEVADRTYRLRDDGHLDEVRFERVVGGDPIDLLDRGAVTVSGGQPERTAEGLCVQARGDVAGLEFRPRVLRGRRWYLRVAYSSDAPDPLPLEVNRGVPYPRPIDRSLPAAPSGTEELIELGDLPGGPPTFGGLRVLVPSGSSACVRRVEVGAFARVGPAVPAPG